MPGILQTAAYASAVLRGVQQREGLPDDVDNAVAARLERRQLLDDGSRQFAFVLEESVLRSGAGGDEVMREQLLHLTTVATRPNVSLGIIPSRPDRPRLPAEGFWIYDAAQVNVELISGRLTVTQPREVAQYADTFVRLAELARHGTGARALIRAAIDTLEPAG
ncbi:DUF5753 domain-containing protein [Jiangella rhizosphaerae]|uniref:DUF5753 domain-containing protein n=1 Tax=Jiangella rhizosphaerae TaxID=2293569 RepID=UPI001F273FB9|nr:DUF5753 domain-containing protein [Jiangella rhizosphaerae]